MNHRTLLDMQLFQDAAGEIAKAEQRVAEQRAALEAEEESLRRLQQSELFQRLGGRRKSELRLSEKVEIVDRLGPQALFDLE